MNADHGDRRQVGRHRRHRGTTVAQATFPTFQCHATPTAAGGFGMPIGRIGALAVALGVGFAVSICHGAGAAQADDTSNTTESSRTESTDTSSSESETAEKDSASPNDTESETDEDSTLDQDQDEDEDDTENEGPAERDKDDEDDRGSESRDDTTFPTSRTSTTRPRHVTETRTVTTFSTPRVDTADQPEDIAVHVAEPNEPVLTTACVTCSGPAARAALPTPVEVLVAPVVAVHTVLSVAQKLLSAFFSPPGGSAQPGLLWVGLAWARREIEQTFFNRTPRIEDQDITLTLEPGDSSLPIDLGAADREGDPLTYRIPSHRAPEHGTVTIDQAAGTFVYTPTDPDYSGTDIFTVTVSDVHRGFHLHGPLSWIFKRQHGHADTAVITITLNPGGTPTTTVTPIVRDDTLTTAEDTRGGGNVLSNDSTAPATGSLIAALAAGPTHGQVVLHDDGTYTYTPDADYHGNDSFTYTATTTGVGGGASATATVTVIVTPVNDAPTGLTGQAGFGAEDTTFGGQLLADDIDSPTTGLGYAVAGQAQHGSVTVSAGGHWSYTPDPDYTGTDSFTFTVTDGQGTSTPVTVSVNVTPVDDAPVGLPGQAGIGAEDTTFGGQLLATDIDGSTGPLRYTLGTQASHGTVTVNTDGSWTYTPATDFNGTDSFTFVVADGTLVSAPALVRLTVTPAHDLPTGNPASASGDEDHDITGQLTGVGDNLAYTLESSPAHGSVTVAADGNWTYTPDPDFHGTDSFTYTVDDGRDISDPVTVSLTVIAVNDTPTAQPGAASATEDGGPITGSFDYADIDSDDLTVTVTQPAGGTVTVTPDGTGYLYTPDPDFSGVDTFTYTVTDDAGAQSTTTITVTVAAVNDRPVATPGLSGTVVEDAVDAAGGTLAGTDVDADSLIYTLNTQAAHGFVTVDPATGAWTYTPDANYHGADSFTFTVTDGTLISTPVEVTVDVTAANDDPVAGGPISLSTDEDSALTITPATLTATDVDGDTLTIAVGQPEHGTLTVGPSGSFVYTPDADFHGVDSFTYTVSDGHGGTATASVTVAVASIPDAPVANPDSVTATADTPTTIDAADLLANDTDGDDDSLIAIIVEHPTYGSLIDNDDGTFTYIPDDGHTGPDSFTYMASDGTQVSPTTVVTISVSDTMSV